VLAPIPTGLLRTAGMRANIAPVASITGVVRRPRARIHKDKQKMGRFRLPIFFNLLCRLGSYAKLRECFRATRTAKAV
jgi:hypothetical protein